MTRKLERGMRIVLLGVLLALAPFAAASADMDLAGLASATFAFSETSPIDMQSLLLSVFLTYCEWTFQLDAGLSGGTFNDVTINGAGPLGDLSLTSALTLDPSTASFVSWKSGLSTSVAEVDIVDVLYLGSPADTSYNQLSISGTNEELTFQATAKVGICPLCFFEANICIGFPLFGCENGNVDLCTLFTDSGGFAMTTVAITGYTLFEDILGVTGTLDATFEFTPDEKSLTPSLQLSPDWVFCPGLELIGEIIASGKPIHIGAVRLKGVKGEFAIGDATFRFAESLTDTANAEITGKADYFEILAINAPLPSCCGSPGSVSVDIFFERSPVTTLFGWGLLQATAEFRLSDALGFSLELHHSSAVPRWGFAITTNLLWDSTSFTSSGS